jgi:hypothetical protein
MGSLAHYSHGRHIVGGGEPSRLPSRLLHDARNQDQAVAGDYVHETGGRRLPTAVLPARGGRQATNRVKWFMRQTRSTSLVRILRSSVMALALCPTVARAQRVTNVPSGDTVVIDGVGKIRLLGVRSADEPWCVWETVLPLNNPRRTPDRRRRL